MWSADDNTSYIDTYLAAGWVPFESVLLVDAASVDYGGVWTTASSE